MAVYLYETAYDPWAAVARQAAQVGEKCGGTAVFVGTMRDFNQGAAVSELWLEHYPAMTERYLWELEAETRARWDVLDTLIIHRFGLIRPSDAIVVVAAWSAHREPAFAACRHLIEELKARAPFWKREQTAVGPRWVEPPA